MKNPILFLSLLLSLFLVSCTNGQETDQAADNTESTETKSPPPTPGPAYANIMVDEFEVMRRDLPDAVVIDVRTQAEVDAGMIEGALHIDVKDPSFKDKIAELDKDATYLVYCRSGNRSKTACNLMNEAGFTDLFNLEGGYLEWKTKMDSE